ncbi:MAG: hypothetical protein ABEN55_05820, partial [Bradymonadaceae bacterium]
EAARGDSSRLQELDRQARAAKTRTTVLYTSGALLAAGGTLLFFLDTSSDGTAALVAPPEDNPRAGLRIGAGHIGAFFKF